MTTNEISAANENELVTVDAAIFADDMDGVELMLDRVKVPTGAGLAFEMPNGEVSKTISGVLAYNHRERSYFASAYTGANEAPECSSANGDIGYGAINGGCRQCVDCPKSKFGSAENGGALCKLKRVLHVLIDGEALPIILTLPSTSMDSFNQYVTRLRSKKLAPSAVETVISLEKAVSKSGIAYSKVKFTLGRTLTREEFNNVLEIKELCKEVHSRKELQTKRGELEDVETDELPFS